MGTFYLKYRDTRPALQVVLKNPDGTVHDLTGVTSVTLHILLNNGTVLSKNMTVVGDPTNGTVRYIWQDADWNAGGLVVSPVPEDLLPGNYDHLMEYEVIGAASERTTFPNADYDILRITDDIGQT